MKKSVTYLCTLTLLAGITVCSHTVCLAEETGAAPFESGTWMAFNGASGQYYFFDPDAASGRTASFENGTGVGFSYASDGEKMIFQMGAADAALPCHVTVIDDTHLSLDWEAQYSETLTYVSPLGASSFHFYTNEELCRMALEDYAEKNGLGETALSAAAADHADGTVTIQLYENLPDHVSTAAWYEIDRRTGEGYDSIMGNAIDLTNGSPDVDIRYLDPSAMPSGSFYECIADQSPYQSQLLLSPFTPVSSFRVVSLDYTETGTFHIGNELFYTDTLTPEAPLLLSLELPELIPNTGILYTDSNGEEKLYSIAMSGLNGEPLLLSEVY